MIGTKNPDISGQTNGWATSTGIPLDKHFVGLYQRLLSLHNGSPHSPQVVGVTSCQRREGVSTVALGLAACAAQLGGGPAVLIDANLAYPSVAGTFGVAAEPGLCEALSGTMELGECVRPSRCEGLSLLTAGCCPRGIAPIYVPATLAAMVAELRNSFATIVFDLPTAEECSPCDAIGRALDGVLLVIESERIHNEIACRAKLRLQQAKVVVLGVVLNMGH